MFLGFFEGLTLYVLSKMAERYEAVTYSILVRPWSLLYLALGTSTRIPSQFPSFVTEFLHPRPASDAEKGMDDNLRVDAPLPIPEAQHALPRQGTGLAERQLMHKCTG